MANGDSTTYAVSDLKNVSNLKIVSLRTLVSNREGQSSCHLPICQN